MKILLQSIFVIFLVSNSFLAQVSSKININDGEKSYLVSSHNINGVVYISGNELREILGFSGYYKDDSGSLVLEDQRMKLELAANNPFAIITDKNKSSTEVIQLTLLPQKVESSLFVSLTEFLEVFNSISERTIIQTSPTRLQVIDRNSLETLFEKEDRKDIKNYLSITIKELNDQSLIVLHSSKATPSFSNFFRGNNLHLIIWDVILEKDSIIESKASPFISQFEIIPNKDYTELIFHLSGKDLMVRYEKGQSDKEFNFYISKREYGKWYVKDSDNFRVIYRDSHSHLVNYLLSAAENSLSVLTKLFRYTPSEKIVINTYDVSDYGFGGTTTIPLNFIRLEIEPLEPGYEVVPYNERFQWLLSHELVHIAVNDAASGTEKFFRSIFGKVNPEKNRPLTVFYSLLTGSNRYTPRWHQEASAVFMETWLSGGFGRVLGNFDEMYFRSLVYEEKEFPSDIILDGLLSHESFLIETLYYIYGGRFAAYLAINYGSDKLLNWFITDPSDLYSGYKSKFKDIFGVNFSSAWNDFIKTEIEFQEQNIKILKTSNLTDFKLLGKEKFGFVTEPYYSRKLNSIIFGYHRSSELATLAAFCLTDYEKSELTTLPTPSAIRVASTAYDENKGLLFYTTNNNQLYRDIRLFNVNSGEDKLLFKDCRTGHLTISPAKNELWGIQHNSAKAILVRSQYPYNILESMVVFDVGDEIQQLSINNRGDVLAAVIHRASGHQSIVLADISKLEEGERFQFVTITSAGSPENPSWSVDDRFLFWNAYTNGVSNIYRYDIETTEIIPITHTIIGLFKPVFISNDSLFAFEFTSDGMRPVLLSIRKAERLPAINYFGQNVLEKNPIVIEWNLSDFDYNTNPVRITEQNSYISFKNLKIQSFIPMISGFQKSKVLGFYTNIADPLLKNEFTFEFGISPFKELSNKIRYHLKFKYDINQTYYLAAEHNSPDFFDLFNKRKRGTLGNRFAVGHNDYWYYDNPLKIKQTTELSYYTDTKFINDNLIEVSEPDFFVFRTEFEYKNLRRTIGSFDYEQGNHFRINVTGFGAKLKKFESAPGAYFEWDNYSLFLFKHNVLRLKFATGYHFLNDKILQAQFFFGGFGNREVDNEPFRQYEKVFRFPGVPIYSIPTNNFIKIMYSNIFPPIRFVSPELFGHYIKNINLSIFSQVLFTDLPETNKWINLGGQVNLMFSHWYNLESTLSAGIAKAWWKGGNDWEWFISYKLLKD